jgi:hypothetical protein
MVDRDEAVKGKRPDACLVEACTLHTFSDLLTSPMRTPFAAFLLAIACGATHAASANPRPAGPNCDLTSPPPAAGESADRGMVMRVFPRTKDIDARYSGCQVLFAAGEGRWITLAVTEVVKGDPVRIWSDQGASEAELSCRYSRGKVVKGNAAQCPEASSLLVKSMPAGCSESQRKAAAAAGGDAAKPKGCDLE